MDYTDLKRRLMEAKVEAPIMGSFTGLDGKPYKVAVMEPIALAREAADAIAALEAAVARLQISTPSKPIKSAYHTGFADGLRKRFSTNAAQAAQMVEAAYKEGFENAPSYTMDNEPWDDMVARYWRESHAYAALTKQEGNDG